MRATWAVLAVGLVAAAALAATTYAKANSRATQSFEASSSSLSSAITSSIRRDEDLVAGQQGLLSAFPRLTSSQFFTAIGGSSLASRYPGGLGFSFVQRVPRAQLQAFAAAQAKDPLSGVADMEPSHFVPFPAGARPYYCLIKVGWSTGQVREPSSGLIATFDFCASYSANPFPAALASATSSGSLVVLPPISEYPGVFYTVAPVYRAGAVPATTARRQADLVGWVLGTFSGKATLRAALGNLSDPKVSLFYQPNDQKPMLMASLGQARGSRHYMSSLPAGPGGRWLIRVTGGMSSGATTSAAIDLLLVVGLTLVLFAFVRLLASSRERALSLVEERTGELRHLALHDALTGLPNRALIADRAGQMLARTHREPLAIGALFIDIDNFKEINDSFGHQRGDLLLRAVAERLRSAVRPSDSVGRLGGDEFVVLVQGDSLDAGPHVVAQRLLEVLDQPFVLEGMDDVALEVRASIGVAIGKRSDADELLRDADVALYQAKQSGKGRYVVFRPEMQAAVQERLELEIDLRSAIGGGGGGELFLEYQPTFHLKTMEMAGAEALARWHHPTRGLVAPDLFIPVAEESGLIVELGRRVLAQSCQQAATWETMGMPLPVSVNVSGRQLDYGGLVADVETALRQSGLSPELLTLELTETALMRDSKELSAQLENLKQLGVHLAIDDFGTGYSSLSYLRRFAVDTLKIDRSFVAGVTRSAQTRAIVHTLVELGARLHLRVLAEGIEDEAQLTSLRQERCGLGQGFYYSRPVSAEKITQIWRDRGAQPSLGDKAPSALRH